MDLIGIIVVLAVVYWAWQRYGKGAQPRTMTVQFKAYSTRKEAMADGHPLTEDGFDQEVVGESHYQAMLVKIVASVPAGCDFVQATLELEPQNPHDKNAVAVKIAGQLVGYLPRAAAKEYKRLAKIKAIPAIAVCPAIIRGSPDTSYGVWLGLPELA